MADKKVSQLTALTAVDAAATDVVPVVDTSASTTKKISLADVAEYVAGATVITNLIPADSDDLAEGATNLYYTTARSALKANLASPTFTGTPAAPTAAVDTNTTQIATTGYVVGQAASVNPIVDGTAAVGTSLKYARQDHVHPTDTSRAALASPTFTGTPAAPTAAVDTNTTQIATTAYVVGQGYLKSSTASTTYIANSLVDAKGDLIVATADNTVTRLAVGTTNNHVLLVDSSTATGMKWAAVPAPTITWEDDQNVLANAVFS